MQKCSRCILQHQLTGPGWVSVSRKFSDADANSPSCRMQSARCSQSLVVAALYKITGISNPSSCSFSVTVSIVLLIIYSFPFIVSVALVRRVIFVSCWNTSHFGNIHVMSEEKFDLKPILRVWTAQTQIHHRELEEKADLVCAV